MVWGHGSGVEQHDAMAPQSRLRLILEEKNVLARECERRGITGTIYEITEIGTWA